MDNHQAEYEKIYAKYAELPIFQAAKLHRDGADNWDHEELERICVVLSEAIGLAKTQNRYVVCASIHIMLSVMTDTHILAESRAAEEKAANEKDKDLN